ncbi:LacI family DNA-binding transcriptional regulator [Xinfangfangia sp. CPCC 101601]|uniref:LacI family DNA-binding transcriptional regulator n=1 Tax=Pseudogemmobacter lacusdianii TaxID=3069608 RepID=A0ABU0VWA3_9RHOB|nr:LacI family DNA-binding transcriptional regulator [Xinfangfangia sp. CPCC 101601]MDQ2066036.1 LacI family DNA-binding transcriptional regulator [Xinfangfangia sp. CPCC 101601]
MTLRPTTKDLAQAAGVSLATVDRVLNGRSGVSASSTEAVHAAIERIGFERNIVAATLARQRGHRFLFALPETSTEFLDVLLDRIAEFRRASMGEMIQIGVLRLDERDPHRAARSLTAISAEDCDGVAIMAAETPQIRDAVQRMRERGINVVSFISNQPEAEGLPFVGIDNAAAGATAGRLMRRFLGPRSGSILVLADTMQGRDSLERRLGFDTIFAGALPQLQVRPTLESYGDPDRTQRVLANAFAAHPDVVGLYLIGMQPQLALATLASRPSAPITIAHERTPSTELALREGRLDAVVHQDPGHLVRSAARILRAQCEKRPILASQERIRIEILIAENL